MPVRRIAMVLKYYIQRKVNEEVINIFSNAS